MGDKRSLVDLLAIGFGSNVPPQSGHARDGETSCRHSKLAPQVEHLN
jgi:hypothetical protein